MSQFRNTTVFTALLGSVAVIAVAAFLLLANPSALFRLREMLHPAYTKPFSFTVDLPGCYPSGSGTAVTKSGFYSGEGAMLDLSKSCPDDKHAPDGLRKIPAGDFGTTLCVGSCKPAPSAETYAQALAILAWSERYNIDLNNTQDPLGSLIPQKVTLKVLLPSTASLANANSITCTTAGSGCTKQFLNNFEICLATKTAAASCPVSGLAASYASAGGLLALAQP